MSTMHWIIRPARNLSRRSGFSVIVILTLACAIGITTAVFSVFHGVLLSPIPYPNPQELVVVYDTQPACKTCPASFPKYNDWHERNNVFSAIAGAAQGSFILTGYGDPERVRAALTTASFADVFSVRPAIGRWYTAQEDRDGGPKLAVLSHAFWQSQLNGNPALIGSKLILDGEPFEIIGIMPGDFVFRQADLFVPLQRKLDPSTRGSHFMPVFARLKKGVSVDDAKREMRALGVALAKEFGTNHGVDVESYSEALVGGLRTPLQVLLGAVSLLLLIGVANVANLMLAAGIARRRELAIHVTLGASLARLAAMLISEGLLLASAGCLLGILLCQWLISVFLVLAANQLPRVVKVQMDATVLAFAVIVAVSVGLICSLFPVFLICRGDLAARVREGDLRGGSRDSNRVRQTLAVAEIALAFGLLVCSALLLKNFILLRNRDTGIRTERIVAFDLSLSGPRYKSNNASTTFYRELYDRLQRIDGIQSVGLISHLPMVNFGWNGEFKVEGESPWKPDEAPLVEYRWFYGDYLKTMGIPLLKGRLLERRDGLDSRTVLVNKTMAEKFWPGKDPIGRHFGQDKDTSKWFEVVGVIGDVRSYGLTRNQPLEFYRTIEQSSFNQMTAVINTRGEDPLAAIPLARQVVRALDPALALTNLTTMEKAVADSLGQPKLMSSLIGLFGTLAGLLAMIGVYSLMAFHVNRQRREFGIRIALGADRRKVEQMVLRKAIILALAGIAIGAVGAFAFRTVLNSLLSDVKSTDPSVFAMMAIFVMLVALLASYLPARAASSVDPMEVIRAD